MENTLSDDKPAAPSLATYQKYTIERVHRSAILNAPYNPRVISKAQERKLRKILQKHGLVGPPTWNKRSGNIVGGHKRMAILDALEGTNNYLLDVAMISVSDKRERELNIALNNREAQGDFDMEAMQVLMVDLKKQSEGDLDLEALGYDRMDIELMFDAPELSTEFSDAAAPPAVQEMVAATGAIVAGTKSDGTPALTEAQKQEIRDAKKAYRVETSKRDESEFMVMLVFNNFAQRIAFMAMFDVNGRVQRHMNGVAMCESLGLKLDEAAAKVDGEP